MPAVRNAASEPSDSIPAESPTFENAMERLEAVVEQMENSKLPLEELIRCYEEGTQLIKVCSERLSAAEQRIEIITRDAAGQPRAADYPPPTAVLAPAPPPRSSKETKPVPSDPGAAAGRASAKQPNEVSLF